MPMSPEGPLPLSGRALSLARMVFTPISLAMLLWVLWFSREQIADIIRQSRASWLLLSCVLWSITHLVAPVIGRLLFRSCGVDMPYAACLRIHTNRLPAKYLPGGIWHSVGRANDYLLLGHPRRTIGTFFLAENLLLVCLTFALGAALVNHLVPLPGLRLLLQAGAVLAVMTAIGFPWLLQRISKAQSGIAWSGYLGAIPSLLVYWCIAGLAFSTYIAAFPALSLDSTVAETIGIYVFSWCIGYLAVFAPQGVGVMELVSGYLLNASEVLQLTGLLAGFRVVILTADLGTWLMMRLLGNRS